MSRASPSTTRRAGPECPDPPSRASRVQLHPGGDGGGLGGDQPGPLLLAHAAPDPVRLAHRERVLEAGVDDGAASRRRPWPRPAAAPGRDRARRRGGRRGTCSRHGRRRAAASPRPRRRASGVCGCRPCLLLGSGREPEGAVRLQGPRCPALPCVKHVVIAAFSLRVRRDRALLTPRGERRAVARSPRRSRWIRSCRRRVGEPSGQRPTGDGGGPRTGRPARATADRALPGRSGPGRRGRGARSRRDRRQDARARSTAPRRVGVRRAPSRARRRRLAAGRPALRRPGRGRRRRRRR